MLLLITMATGLLFDSWCQGDLSAQILLENVSGSVTIDTNTWMLRTNLSGSCGSVSISIHEFPVVYGSSLDPCDPVHIGIPHYNISMNGLSQVAVDPNTKYNGRALVLRTCGQQTCANLLTMTGSPNTWKALVRSGIIGQVYFLQPSDLQPITAVVELAQLEGTSTFNASLFFSDTCQVNGRQLLGSVEVGPHQKSRLELATTHVKPYLLIKYQERWSCAEVTPLRPKQASAHLSMQGVRGSLSFRQESPFHPTQLSINVWGLRGLGGHYRIHSLPVSAQAGPDRCGEAHSGQLWNPLGSPAERRGHSSWPVGDLSGRHGALQGVEQFGKVLDDWNLPLYGNNSVIGRSVLVSKANGEPWACGTIHLVGDTLAALASFRKGVVGRIMFQQAASDPYGDLTVYMELSHVSDNVSRDHNWHIHEFPLQSEAEGCASAGGHFNPYGTPTGGTYSQECTSRNPLRCEAGDYAGRHGPITLLAPAPGRYLFTDSSSSLIGPMSIIGRSVVIHGPEGVSSRVACANILLHPTSEGRSGPWFGSGDASGEYKASQVSEFTPTVIDVTFHGLRGHAGGFHVHLLPVTGGPDAPCSEEKVRGHFNPFQVKMADSPAAGHGTDDEYEVGDISGRHGSLQNLENKTGRFLDMNLPLSGPHSVLGRSLVVHYANGSRMQCATFQQQLSSGGERVRVTAEFSTSVRGRISLNQIVYPNGGSSDTTIMVDLQPVSWDKSFSWSIHTGDGETYNPYEIPNQARNWSWCGPQRFQHCRVGDLLGKHGPISPGNRVMLTDTNLPLSGDFTVVRRTLVLSLDFQELSSPLLPDVPIASLRFQAVPPLNRSALRDAVSAALRVPPWKVTFLSETQDGGTCQRVEFFIIGFNDTSALNSLQAQESLGPFCTRCCPGAGSSGAPRTSSVLFLLIGSLLVSQL